SPTPSHAPRPQRLDIAGRFLRVRTLHGRHLPTDASPPRPPRWGAGSPSAGGAAAGAVHLAPRRAVGRALAGALARRVARPAGRAEAAAQGVPAGPRQRVRSA